MKLRSLPFLLAPILLLSACKAQYRDVSTESEYRGLIGAVCEVTAPMRAHGITNTIEKSAKTDFIAIWNPNASGPEVTFALVLQPGTKMRIVAARECTNCLGTRLPEYRVEVVPSPSEFADKPAFLRASSLTQDQIQCPTRGSDAT